MRSSTGRSTRNTQQLVLEPMEPRGRSTSQRRQLGRWVANPKTYFYLSGSIIQFLKNLVLPMLIATGMQVIEEPEELVEDLCEARCSDLEQRRADRYIWDLGFCVWCFVFGIWDLIFSIWDYVFSI